jgi:hypothetical protein
MDGRSWRGWRLAVLLGLLLALISGGAESAGTEGTIVASVRPNPLKLTVQAPRSAHLGESIRVQATLENAGSERLREVAVQLHLDTTGFRMLGPARHQRGVLPGSDRLTVEWRVRPLETGDFVLLASATARDAGNGLDLTAESQAVLLTVTE